MATAITTAATETRGITQAELKAELLATAKEALGPIVEAAIAPFTKAQTDLASHLTLITSKADVVPESVKLDAALGPYPIGRKIRALAMAALDSKTSHLDPDRAIYAIRKANGSPDSGRWPLSMAEPTIKWLEYVKATLLVGSASAAGDIIMPVTDPEWIELLRHNTTIRGIARTIPMPRGSVARRKQTGTATATYIGETGKITATNLTVTRVSLSYKKLTAATIVGNDLIRFSGGEADRMVQEDLLAVTARREDQAFLVDDGTSNTPKGIKNWTAAANIFAKTGTSLNNYQADLTKAIRLVQAADVDVTPDNSYFIMSVSTYWALYALVTTTGDWVFAQGLENKRLFGFKVLVTTQLEVSNAWIGAALGMIMFVNAPSLEIHDSMARTVNVHPYGAYYDGTVVQSGISNDETVITCIGEHDFFQKYDLAASIITTYAT
jgi:HK97 family phage major capsid protein